MIGSQKLRENDCRFDGDDDDIANGNVDGNGDNDDGI